MHSTAMISIIEYWFTPIIRFAAVVVDALATASIKDRVQVEDYSAKAGSVRQRAFSNCATCGSSPFWIHHASVKLLLAVLSSYLLLTGLDGL